MEVLGGIIVILFAAIVIVILLAVLIALISALRHFVKWAWSEEFIEWLKS